VSSRRTRGGESRRGREAFAFADRAACGDVLLERARRGDRIIIMGARDDSLSQFARELVDRLGAEDDLSLSRRHA